MADVLIVYLNPVLYPFATPYGAAIIQNSLGFERISSEVFLPFFYEEPEEAFSIKCEESSPQIIAFSFRNLDTAGFAPSSKGQNHFLDILKQFVKIAFKHTDAVVVGGSGFTIAPSRILESTGAYLGFCGPAEYDFTCFCKKYLKSYKLHASAKGLQTAIFKGCQINGKVEAFQQLDKPCEYDSSIIEFVKLSGSVVPVRTKTGCTNHCNYCVVPSIESLQLRHWKDIEYEFDMILQAELNDRVFIADGEFNVPSSERAFHISHNIEARFGNQIRWSCYLTPPDVDKKLLQKMASAGCVGVSINVDSLSDLALSGHNKSFTVQQARETIDLCLEEGFVPQVNLLFGGPHESYSTVDETISAIKEYELTDVTFTIGIGLRIYPRTGLNTIARNIDHKQYSQWLNDAEWLGTYCSPCDAELLEKYIQGQLPASDKILYCNSVSEMTTEYYQQLAVCAQHLGSGDIAKAESLLNKLNRVYPDSDAIELGLLKCKVANNDFD